MAENKINNMDLESAMKRLDQVVNELSEQNIKLEKSLALYEEGVALVRYCNSKLECVERKIEALRMTEDGEIVKVPFGAE